MTTRELLEDLKKSYSQLVIYDDKNAMLPVGIDTEFHINADKPVKEWKFWDKKEKKELATLALTELMKTTRQDLAEIWHDIKERSGNKKEETINEPMQCPDEQAVEDQENEEPQWSVPAPKGRVREIETVNLPAPVGISGIVRPAVTAAEALAAWNEFQALKNYIIEKSDIQVIQGRNHIKKSGWRKFATFYNLTDQIVEETQVPLEKGGFYWKIKVVCTAPNGRQAEGVGLCAFSEKSGARALHDTYTTAHTRAKNRAISDMIAAGEVSAEEMA
jgi:hypothetical protein